MEESILNTVKKVLGIDPAYEVYDLDLLIYINGIFADLHQIGFGPKQGFGIHDAEAKWSDYTHDNLLVENIKPFIIMRCRQSFDPPQTGPLAEALDAMIKKQEWRIYLYADQVEEAST